DHDVKAPSAVRPELPQSLDAVVLRRLARSPDVRFASGLEMALALESALAPARAADVGAWVRDVAAGELARRTELLAAMERGESATTTATVAARVLPRRTGGLPLRAGVVVLGVAAALVMMRLVQRPAAPPAPAPVVASAIIVATPEASASVAPVI